MCSLLVVPGSSGDAGGWRCPMSFACPRGVLGEPALGAFYEYMCSRSLCRRCRFAEGSARRTCASVLFDLLPLSRWPEEIGLRRQVFPRLRAFCRAGSLRLLRSGDRSTLCCGDRFTASIRSVKPVWVRSHTWVMCEARQGRSLTFPRLRASELGVFYGRRREHVVSWGQVGE